MDAILRKYAMHKIITECAYGEEGKDVQNVSISGNSVQIENLSIAQRTFDDTAIQAMKGQSITNFPFIQPRTTTTLESSPGPSRIVDQPSVQALRTVRPQGQQA